MNKKFIVFASIIIAIIIVLASISYSSKIKNPFVGLKGIVQIEIGKEKVEKISDEPLRYISKSYDDFISYMELEGYLVERMGRGFQLEKGNEKKYLVSEGFMGVYEIFSEPQK